MFFFKTWSRLLQITKQPKKTNISRSVMVFKLNTKTINIFVSKKKAHISEYENPSYTTEKHKMYNIQILPEQYIFGPCGFYLGHVKKSNTNMLGFQTEVITRTVIPRMESVAKMPKLNPKINLRISSDLGVTNSRFILCF